MGRYNHSTTGDYTELRPNRFQ